VSGELKGAELAFGKSVSQLLSSVLTAATIEAADSIVFFIRS
jgi:hypothetical protein